MYGIVTILALWLALGVIAVGIVLSLSVKLFWISVDTKKKAEKYAQRIKTRTDDRYNKLISLTPSEFDTYLSSLFSQQLELVSITQVSEKDPDAAAILYTKAVNNLLVYLGQENLQAINYYYGNNYVIRWCDVRYKLLENRGVITKIINKEMYAETISREI